MVPSSAAAVPLTASQYRCFQPAAFTSYEQLRLSLKTRPAIRGIAGVRDRGVDDPSTGVMIGAHGCSTSGTRHRTRGRTSSIRRTTGPWRRVACRPPAAVGAVLLVSFWSTPSRRTSRSEVSSNVAEDGALSR